MYGNKFSVVLFCCTNWSLIIGSNYQCWPGQPGVNSFSFSVFDLIDCFDSADKIGLYTGWKGEGITITKELK